MRRLILLTTSALFLAVFVFYTQSSSHLVHDWTPIVYSGPFGGLRDQFLASVSGVTEDSAGLVAGLAIGDTSRLSSITSDTMKMVSLTHLTAVSGANCAIVVGAIYLVLRQMRLSRWLRISVSLAGLLIYVLIVGPEPSVLRAAVMASIVLVATGLGRAGAASQSLALCVIVLLISNPWLASNFGFQLSVLATLGILQLAPALSERLKAIVPRWLAMALAVSIAAQVFCLPVLLELQPGLSTYSVPANILAEPLVAPITVLGILSCLVVPVTPWLASALTWIASLGAWLIIEIANFFASLPSATVGWPSGVTGTVLAVLVILALITWHRGPNQRARVMSALAIGLVVAAVLGSCTAQRIRAASWPPKEWVVVSCDVGQGDATIIRSAGQIALIDVGRKPGPVRQCLRDLGVTHLDYLVLTHFDMDHVGGLDGALAVATVDEAIVTGFQDERPAAAITWRKLMQHARHLTEAETGMTGSLGEFSWQVLAPNRGAPEAEDSNDGSVVILFKSAALNVLTLADLGEKGQMRLAAESANWLGTGFGDVPMVVKVSHHGSADQYPEFYEAIRPNIGLFSVGLGNDYGHPTARTLNLVESTGAQIHRTDLEGSISVSIEPEGLRVSSAGRG